MGAFGSPYLNSMKTYYLYEVPTKKNGATKDWETRSRENFEQYRIEPIIIETMEGPDTPEFWQVVGDREWELADQNGYKRGQHYRVAMIARQRGGSVQGSKNVESGHIHTLSSYRSKESYCKPRPYSKKLSAEQVNLILNDNRSLRVIARDYNVSHVTISIIKKGNY